MKVYYHGGDFDGKGSAAIIKAQYKNVRCIPLNHGKEFIFDYVKPNEVVYMVDFSLPWGDMVKLKYSCKRFIWIDHHISQIREYEEYSEKTGDTFDGLRRVGDSAIELTWEYMNEGKEMPLPLRLLGRYDVWDLDYHPDVMNFQYGLRSYDPQPEDPMWEDMMDISLGEEIVMGVAKQGAAILAYQKIEYERYMNSYSFQAEFEGYTTLCVNRQNTSSQIFQGFYDPEIHDIMMCFVYNGDGRWRITLYTEKDEIDCSAIAKKYGGGGHAKAAGFVTEENLFDLFKIY